jgi:SAM-dependent methyltransferase
MRTRSKHVELPTRFAAAFAMSSLLHTPPGDLPRALDRVKRVLEPGGIFYLGQYGGIAFEGPWLGDNYDPPRYFSRLTDAELQRVAGERSPSTTSGPSTWARRPHSAHFQSMVLRVP